MPGQKQYIASVIMPCYNMATLTGDRMLELDRLFHIRKDFEVIVVNNGSSDQTRSILKWWSDNADWRFLVKHKQKNVGFGPAVNEGTKAARGDYVFIISNDVALKGDFFSDFINFLEREEEQEFLLGGRVIDWAAGWNEFPGEPPIHYVEGWFLAAKTRIWRQIGGFDERFVPYDYEDIDLSYRAQQQGIQLRQISAPIQHAGAGTIGFNPSRRAITEKHRLMFAEKWNLTWAPVR
jgi:GT2 family glycosyltransferase